MQPTPENSASLDTLRQLEALLAAGTLTPQEFDTLKQRLIFGPAPAAPASNPVPTAASPAATGPVPGAPDDATPLASLADLAGPPLPADSAPELPLPYLDSASALTPEALPLLAPEPDWLAAPAPPLLTSVDESVATESEYEPTGPAAERRNPLNLVFALGMLVLFLGVMAYLLLGRHPAPDEHLTSTSQTAADSATVVPETGPQAEQLTLPPVAGPDTVRVVPATPPATVVDEATADMDSTAAMPETLPTPAANAPAAKPAAAKPAATVPAATKPAATVPTAAPASTAPADTAQ